MDRSSERLAAHSPSRVVLPKPAGAEINISLRPASGSSLAISRGRATRFGRVWKGRNLVDTSVSDAPIIVGSPPMTHSTSYRRHLAAGATSRRVRGACATGRRALRAPFRGARRPPARAPRPRVLESSRPTGRRTRQERRRAGSGRSFGVVGGHTAAGVGVQLSGAPVAHLHPVAALAAEKKALQQ